MGSAPGCKRMDGSSAGTVASQGFLSRTMGSARPFKRKRLAQVLVVALVCWFAVTSSRQFAAQGVSTPAPVSSDTSSLGFVVRIKNGQSYFRQGEIISIELGYGADDRAPVKRFVDHPDRPGLAVDRLVLSPRTGVVDPLRDFLGTVSGWSGPPPRELPFVEAGGSWTAADINEWFRFDKPGKYSLSVLAHKVRSSFEAFGSPPATATTLKSNTVAFEIVPADTAWQAATLQMGLSLLETQSTPELQRQGCRILRFLATPQAVDKMVEHYTDQRVYESDYRYGLFAFPDRDYAVSRMEDGLLDPSVAVSADYLDTLARLSAYLEHPEFLPDKDEQHLGTTGWAIGGPIAAHPELIEAEHNRYIQELLGALDDKLVAPRALCLKAIFDSPMLGQPTLLKSADSRLVEKLRKEIADIFTQLPISAQLDLLYTRWDNIASPAMVPILRQLYENPPPGRNEQFIAFILNDLFQLDPTEGRALILEELKRPRPRLDIRFVKLLPDEEILELDNPLIENLEAGNGDEDTTMQLIARYATPAIYPRVLAFEERRYQHLTFGAQVAFLSYAVKSDPVQGVAMLDEALTAHNQCSMTALSEIASRKMTPEIESLAIARLRDPDPGWAAGAATILGRHGSAEAQPPLWDCLEKWHTRWAGHANDLPNGSGIALKNGMETALELALIDALGSGQSWFAGTDDLERLARLCLSSGGCQRVQEIARQATGPSNINVYGSKQNYHASVAQYRVDSIDSLKQKLGQFPEGTVFTWSFGGDEKEGVSILADLRAFLKEHGMSIR